MTTERELTQIFTQSKAIISSEDKTNLKNIGSPIAFSEFRRS